MAGILGKIFKKDDEKESVAQTSTLVPKKIEENGDSKSKKDVSKKDGSTLVKKTEEVKVKVAKHKKYNVSDNAIKKRCIKYGINMDLRKFKKSASSYKSITLDSDPKEDGALPSEASTI